VVERKERIRVGVPSLKVPGEPRRPAPWNIITWDGIRIICVLRSPSSGKTQPARFYPEAIGPRSGVARRSDEKDCHRALAPSLADVDTWYGYQVATVGKQASRGLRGAISLSFTDQLSEVRIDHCTPKVAGGTAKKCFGSP
jgi:hypothetical protein